MAICCCTASPGAAGAATRCTSATRAAASMSATTCARIRACRPANTSALPRVDAAVAQAFLTALAPAEIDALSSARRAQQQVDKALRQSAEQQLERQRYEAALAERQFNRVDPDNRLVAAELERRWEAALNEVRAAEDALARAIVSRKPSRQMRRQGAQRQCRPSCPAACRRSGRIRARPTLNARRCCAVSWRRSFSTAASTTSLRVRIVWRGGAVSEIDVKMRVNSVASLTRGAEMQQRVLDLARTRCTTTRSPPSSRAKGIAHRIAPTRSCRSLSNASACALASRDSRAQRTRWQHATDLLSAQELAGVLNIPVNWIYVQIRTRAASDRSPSFRRAPVLEHANRDRGR